MNTTSELDKLFAALAAAQAEFPAIPKLGNNPRFDSHYSELEDMIEKTKPILKKFGLGVCQPATYTKSGRVGCKTILFHESGQALVTRFAVMPNAKQQNGQITPQDECGCVTYARRYSYSGTLGLAEKDDDGNSISQTTNTATPGKIDYTAKPKASPAGRAAAANSMKSTFTAPFGKWKGMTPEQLAEIDPEELESYMHWMAKPKDGKPISPNAQAFIDVIYDLLNRPQSVVEPRKMVSLPGFDDAPAPTDMDIPF